MPGIISDHMVLQSGQSDPLWGWTPPGTTVKAEFLDPRGKIIAQETTTTTPRGKWMLKLPPFAPGTQGQLRITAGSDVQTVNDVLVGETWLCSGQSNMGYTFDADNMVPAYFQTAKDQATAAKGEIRNFTIWDTPPADAPVDDVKGHWIVDTADQIHSISCVAWFFGAALQKKLNRPVGLIISASPGTRVEEWMSKGALDACSVGPGVEKEILAGTALVAPRIKAWQDADDAWLKANPTPELQARNKTSRPQRKDWPPPMFSSLYNSTIYPLVPYGIKGVIWYQADGNLDGWKNYGAMVKSLIENWRADWGAELPFYYVEMNNMRDDVQTVPVKFNDLSLLREQQATALALPQVDVACSIDVGLPVFEPHFPNKQPVGDRLALLALDHVYGVPSECHSPTYSSFNVEGNKLRVHFSDADGLCVRGGGEMKGFAIRGATGDWAWAKGQVDGKDVELWSDQVPQPVAARYAWAANPITSMENGAGFPMRPFRTDKDSPQ